MSRNPRSGARRPGFGQPVNAGGPELLSLISDASQPAPVWIGESQSRPGAGGALGKVGGMLECGARRRTER